MDYDDDGILDFISGSYDPGDLYLFRGLGEGKYAAVETIVDESGLPLVHHPEKLAEFNRLLKDDPSQSEQETLMARVASFGSWVTPVDWDDDGDLDLVIGSFGGEVFLRLNSGSRAEPSYDEQSHQLRVGEDVMKVKMHAAPVAADWDEDGLWDLVVGSGDGSVGWFRNVGTPREPAFAERRLLVDAKSEGKFLIQYLADGEVPSPGVRAQIDVVDYNGDGRLDLLVGDYCDVAELKPMSEVDRAKLDALAKEEKALIASFQELYEDEEAMAKAQARLAEITEAKKPFLQSEGQTRRASFVWLYLRTPRRSAR